VFYNIFFFHILIKMKRSRPSRPYISVPKLRIKAAKKQHDDGETQEHNVVEDASESDDVLEGTSESDDVAETPDVRG
jgi:hypothetical protein